MSTYVCFSTVVTHLQAVSAFECFSKLSFSLVSHFLALFGVHNYHMIQCKIIFSVSYLVYEILESYRLLRVEKVTIWQIFTMESICLLLPFAGDWSCLFPFDYLFSG